MNLNLKRLAGHFNNELGLKISKPVIALKKSEANTKRTGIGPELPALV